MKRLRDLGPSHFGLLISARPGAICKVPLLLLIFCNRRFKAYSSKVWSGPGIAEFKSKIPNLKSKMLVLGVG